MDKKDEKQEDNDNDDNEEEDDDLQQYLKRKEARQYVKIKICCFYEIVFSLRRNQNTVNTPSSRKEQSDLNESMTNKVKR